MHTKGQHSGVIQLCCLATGKRESSRVCSWLGVLADIPYELGIAAFPDPPIRHLDPRWVGPSPDPIACVCPFTCCITYIRILLTYSLPDLRCSIAPAPALLMQFHSTAWK